MLEEKHSAVQQVGVCATRKQSDQEHRDQRSWHGMCHGHSSPKLALTVRTSTMVQSFSVKVL